MYNKSVLEDAYKSAGACGSHAGDYPRALAWTRTSVRVYSSGVRVKQNNTRVEWLLERVACETRALARDVARERYCTCHMGHFQYPAKDAFRSY